MAYTLLYKALVADKANTKLAAAVGSDLKGTVSMLLYSVGDPAAFLSQWISAAIYVAVAVMWLIPDRRIEGAPGSPQGF